MAGIIILDMGHNTQLYLGLHDHEQEIRSPSFCIVNSLGVGW